MSVITQNHILNIVPGMSAPVVVHVSQGDSGVELEFVLVNGSEIFDPTGTVISVHGIRQDGTGWGPVACAREDGKIKFTLPDAATAVKGSGMAELSISNGEETVGTTNFAILVETASFPQGVTYANDVSVYEAILAYVDQMGEQTVENVEADLAAEIANRQAADAVLQQNINSEASTRAGADTTLQTNLNNAVSSLNEALANEVSARTSADSTLQGNIDSEENARILADNALGTRIDEIIAPSGGAPSAAEVTDARIGYNNTVYPSLGDAIRSQVENIEDLLGINEFTATMITGGYVYDTTGNITPSQNDDYCDYVYVPLGMRIKVSNLKITSHRSICTYNKDKEFVRTIASDSSLTEVTFQLEGNECYFRATAASGNTIIYKYVDILNLIGNNLNNNLSMYGVDGSDIDGTSKLLTCSKSGLVIIDKDVYIKSSIELSNVVIINFANIYVDNSTGIILKNNVKLIGGNVVSLKNYDNQSPIVRITGKNNKVQGVYFRHATDHHSMIYINNVTGSRYNEVFDCRFDEWVEWDILVSSGYINIQNCIFETHSNNTQNSVAIKCSNDLLDDTETAIADEARTGGYDITICGCTFLEHLDNAIDTFSAGKRVLIDGNNIFRSGNGGIEVKIIYRASPYTSGTSFVSGRYSQDIVISNNIFYNQTAGYGITLIQTNPGEIENPIDLIGVLIVGNIFRNVRGAVTFTGVKSAIVSDNYIYQTSVTTPVFNIGDNNKDIIIKSNVISAAGRSVITNQEFSTENVIIDGNIIEGRSRDYIIAIATLNDIKGAIRFNQLYGNIYLGSFVDVELDVIDNDITGNSNANDLCIMDGGKLKLRENTISGFVNVVNAQNGGDYIIASNNLVKDTSTLFINGNTLAPISKLLLSNNIALIQNYVFYNSDEAVLIKDYNNDIV